MTQSKSNTAVSGTKAGAAAGPKPAGESTRGRRGSSSSSSPRGGPRRGLAGVGERLVRGWERLLELPAVWVTLLLVAGGWSLLPAGLFFAPDVVPGSIATRDFLAPKDLLLPDEETSREKQRRAREEVLAVYDYDSGVIAELDADLGRLFAAGRARLEGAPESLFEQQGWENDLKDRLQETSGVELAPAQAALLAAKGFSADLEDRLRSLATQVLRRGIVTSKPLLLENRLRGITVRDLGSGEERTDFDLYDRLGFPDEVREFVESEVRSWGGLAPRERRTVVDLLLAVIPPNLHLNRSETVRRGEAAVGATDPVFTQIRKGQVIVRKGDQIGAAQARAISMSAGEQPLHRAALPVLGTLFLLALAAAVLWLALRTERVADHSRERLFGEALLLLLVSLLVTRLSFQVAAAFSQSFEAAPLNSLQSYVFSVPFAALALVAALLFGRQPALMLAMLYSLLIGRQAVGDPMVAVIFSLAGSLAAVFGLERYQFKQRLVMTRLGLLVGVVNVAAVLILLALGGAVDRGPTQIAFDLLCAFAGGLLVAAAASFAVPVLEATLSITTDIKLVELANTNLPLLRRLAFEAPGTFQHSLMVANLGKVGCEVVGADSTLAYTGGLYHDIGKVFRPDYFVENQRPGLNPHDKLTPSMSALILVSHVKEGVELARQHRLPQPIVDAIEQHHGTRLIKFFYNRAVERCDPDTEEVTEEKYRYPGPLPQNKVMGVLMLADAVEAASRTLVDPTEAKIRGLIRTLVEDCLRDGQLDATDLTLRDLRRVSDAFLRVLTNIFHKRVDYPGFDFNAQPRRERRAVVDAAARAS